MNIEELINPAWKKARKQRCIQLFKDLKCIKREFLNADADDDNFQLEMSMLDEDKMMTRMLDCAAALGILQQERVATEETMATETQTAKNKVFQTAINIFLDNELAHDGANKPRPSNAVDQLSRAFPDETKLTDGRNWLPLHWAAVVASEEGNEERISDAEVKVIYTSDPMVMQQYHLAGTATGNMGYTPAHLLCMQGIASHGMSLIRYFSICNSRAFTMSASYPGRDNRYSFSALHAACFFGEPTEALIKLLVQLDRSQTEKMFYEHGLTPIGLLCANRTCSDRLIGCLLEVNSSAEALGIGIVACVVSPERSNVLEWVEMMLKANPEATKHRSPSGKNLLHFATSWEARYTNIPFQLCIDIMQQIVAIHKDAVREVCPLGWLPVHYAASYSTVEVMEFLLSLYPESASVLTTSGSENLLCLAISDIESSTSVMEAKVRFLCTRYPAMMLQRDGRGFAPLCSAFSCPNNMKIAPVVQVLCEAGGQELVKMPIAHPTDTDWLLNGLLPLHCLVLRIDFLVDSLLSKEADCFRLLLRLYPEAAGIEGGVGVDHKKTPYQRAVDKNLPPYYLRLLLRAAPDLNPAELHRLNYAERRMAMFLAFRAVTTQVKPTIMARLLGVNRDLVKYVVSFL